MCFSFEISIGTFLFTWSISIYLLSKNLNNNQKKNIIFLMIFSSMQLADAILWYSKMEKNNMNYITTSFVIPFILSLQILFNVYYINKNKNILITFIVIASILYIFKKFNGYSKSVCENKLSSPIWGSNEINLLELFIFALLILYPKNLYKADKIWLLLTFIIILLTITFVLQKGGAYGSLWCTIANLIAIYYLYKY